MAKRVDPIVSDMFFHMQHKQRDLLYKRAAQDQQNVDLNAERKALLNDAYQMCIWLKYLGHKVDANDLVIDFFKRI